MKSLSFKLGELEQNRVCQSKFGVRSESAALCCVPSHRAVFRSVFSPLFLFLSYQAAALEQRGLSHWPWHTATPITTGTSAEESTPTLWYQSLCTSGRRSQLEAEVNLGGEDNAHHMMVFLFQLGNIYIYIFKKNLWIPMWILYLIWNNPPCLCQNIKYQVWVYSFHVSK